MKRILWIPHVACAPGARTRDEYFLEHLSVRHQVHRLTWTTYRDHTGGTRAMLQSGLRDFRFRQWREGRCTVHHMPRIPSPVAPRYPRWLMWLNERFLHAAIRRVRRMAGLDVIVCAPNAWLIGFPPFDSDVPVVFDYLDCLDWEDGGFFRWAELQYLKRSAGALAVSHIAQRRALALNPRSHYLPNGVDLAKIRACRGEKLRTALGLEHSTVVSFIGYGTTSPTLYFVEAVLLAKQRVTNLVCMQVGSNPPVESRVREVDPQGRTFLLLGSKSYPDVLRYFHASDMGLYPVDETPYYHAASPIKIFEYSAAGKPVIAPRLHELQSLQFTNLVFCAPEAGSLADAMVDVAQNPPPRCAEERLAEYDWVHLTRRLEQAIEEVVGR